MSYASTFRSCPYPKKEPPFDWKNPFRSSKEKERIASVKRIAEWSKTLNAFKNNTKQREIRLSYSDCGDHVAKITKNDKGFIFDYGWLRKPMQLKTISEVIYYIDKASKNIAYGVNASTGFIIPIKPPCNPFQNFFGSDTCK